ncbi:hypothetical protein NIES593_22595 [Hydrococcus rivularis NIES-593]|uniref:SGNH/GDSL hydrolase family protein n=1 Tax=Hydrococcus rivularis NIES-593 TaxID=1921803 RepID=A0A1U7H776_9CYAN|nr:hypothetical protein [Hydrococcus rivularis]OKH17952.1 hypothetical protein NIES593_22595 [Hydrococcus rivularis NIES-593]
MTNPIPPDLLVGLEGGYSKVPEEVKEFLCTEPRPPETDPTLGISVAINRQETPQHRLVTIGDSLTHGFQSGAIFKTNLSYPMLIAREMGWSQNFRHPSYFGPGDGLPLNLEKLARELGNRYQIADGINAIDAALLLPWLRGYLDQIEDYWERGEGLNAPERGAINHNLAVYGWDLRNTLSRNADIAKSVIRENPPKEDFIRQVSENANEIATLWVLNSARNSANKALTPLEAAKALGEEGEIETLIILIGANNALGSILTFKLRWSDVGYQDMRENDKYTVWLPSHFKDELDQIVERVKQIKARHVIWGTVPHVTIAPFARGVSENGQKIQPGSRYFPFYVPIWLENTFNPNNRRHPRLTANQARGIDSAIDKYNEYIVATVREGRRQGKDWYLLETAGLLDRLAVRRYIEDWIARPNWWTEYPLPEPLKNLNPQPTSLFFKSNQQGRQQGGLFSLDGIHPTTIGYGILAQEIINIMQLAGVEFYESDGITKKTGKIEIDFARLIKEDTLISKPPAAVSAILDSIGWLDSMTGIISQLYQNNI